MSLLHLMNSPATKLLKSSPLLIAFEFLAFTAFRSASSASLWELGNMKNKSSLINAGDPNDRSGLGIGIYKLDQFLMIGFKRLEYGLK